jgi:hypothetical protein
LNSVKIKHLANMIDSITLSSANEGCTQALNALAADPSKVVLMLPEVLGTRACEQLRQFADAHASTCETVDAMDGENESQLTLTKSELEGLIGKVDVARLWALPQQLEEIRPNGQPKLPSFWLATVSVSLTSRLFCCSW